MYYWILSTPRPGGQFLSSLLNGTGLFPNHLGYDRAFDEWHDFEVKQKGRATFEALPICLNIHFNDINGPTYEQLSKFVSPAKFVVLKRQDIIAQAVSCYIAEKTKVWRIKKSEKEEYLRKNIEINDNHILRSFRYASKCSQAWSDFIANDAIHVFYEDLRDNTAETLSRVLEHFDHKPTKNLHEIIGQQPLIPMQRPETETIRRRMIALIHP